MKNNNNIINYKEIIYLLDRQYMESLYNPKKVFTYKQDMLWRRLCNWYCQDDEEEFE